MQRARFALIGQRALIVAKGLKANDLALLAAASMISAASELMMLEVWSRQVFLRQFAEDRDENVSCMNECQRGCHSDPDHTTSARLGSAMSFQHSILVRIAELG